MLLRWIHIIQYYSFLDIGNDSVILLTESIKLAFERNWLARALCGSATFRAII